MHHAKRLAASATSVLVTGVAFAACGGSGYTPSASARAAFVEARAQALCKVSDQTFSSQTALEQAYTSAQKAAISAKDERWLKSHLETDDQLRADISARFSAMCPAGS